VTCRSKVDRSHFAVNFYFEVSNHFDHSCSWVRLDYWSVKEMAASELKMVLLQQASVEIWAVQMRASVRLNRQASLGERLAKLSLAWMLRVVMV